jgi:hypothetical protein
MGILDKVAKIEKKIEKLATRKDVARHPVEIRRGILDAIEEHVEPAGRSRRVLPYNHLTVTLLAAAAQRATFEAVLSPEELTRAISDHLKETGCEAPTFELSVRFVKKAPAGWDAGSAFEVTYDRQEPARTSSARPAAAPATAQIVVLKGQATKKTYLVTGERTNIGRMAEVTDKDNHVVRRNQVVFLDSDDEANRTVSRAQAHIHFAAPAEYRLRDDRSSHGTRIFREGRTIEIQSGSPRGVKLRFGDEIYFGQACVRFEGGSR